MADTVTTNYGWTKPENDGSDDTWGLKWNDNADDIDTTVKAVSVAANAAQADATTALGRKMHSLIFTSSGTFTVPAGTASGTVFKFTVLGAGGGAGGGGANGSGGGGGAGGTAIAYFHGFAAAQAVTVTIGAAGPGGAAGSDGTVGGTSKITATAVDIITCIGGAAGKGQPGTASTVGSSPGSITVTAGASGLTLDGYIQGMAGSGEGGQYIAANTPPSARGGDSLFGTGGVSVTGTTNGNAGTGNGSGGGSGTGVTATGGAGTAGAAMIEWTL